MRPSIPPRWVLHHPTWPLVALHVPLTVQVPVYTILGMEGTPHKMIVPVVASAAAGALQLRHSLAAARGDRPARWPVSLALLALLAYLPLWWYGTAWEGLDIFVLASAVMLLRGRVAVCAATVAVAVTVVNEVVRALRVPGGTIGQAVIEGGYGLVVPTLFAAALVGGARLAWLVNELYATRTDLAAQAVGAERMRVSRDLHDLLGQSLVAVSLKGDVALRLLTRDTGAARAEIESLTTVARDALRDVRAITHDEHTMSLRTELDGAAALLAAAGVETSLDVDDIPPLAGPVRGALAWVIREGTTNLLRHSKASSCAISLARDDDAVRLEIVNDGVDGTADHGSGLSGMAERARALSGTATAVVHDGRFRLRFEIPVNAT